MQTNYWPLETFQMKLTEAVLSTPHETSTPDSLMEMAPLPEILVDGDGNWPSDATLDLNNSIDSETTLGPQENLATKMEAMSTLHKQIQALEKALSSAIDENMKLKRKLETEISKQKSETLKKSKKNGEIHKNSRQNLNLSEQTPSTPNFGPSFSSNNCMMILGESQQNVDNCSSDGKQHLAHGPTKTEMYKLLKSAKWPKPEIFHTHDEFVVAIRTQIDNIRRQGVNDNEIAFHLNNELIASSLGPSYATHSRGMDVTSLNGVLKALIGCDQMSNLLTKNEKWERIRQAPNEDLYSVMRRLESAYEDYQIGDLRDKRARLRIIREQFCHAASLPAHISNNLRHCQDLQDMVFIAIEDLRKQQWQQHNTQNVASSNVNSMTTNRPTPDSNWPRAPTAFEFDHNNKDILVCLRCRLINQHKANGCPYKKFCSNCQIEGHTDYEHRKVVQAMDARHPNDLQNSVPLNPFPMQQPWQHCKQENFVAMPLATQMVRQMDHE